MPLASARAWSPFTVPIPALLDTVRDLASASSGSIRYTWAKKLLSLLVLEVLDRCHIDGYVQAEQITNDSPGTGIHRLGNNQESDGPG